MLEMYERILMIDTETANDIDSFKKSIELLIERLMLGFLQENNHRFMEINLFDFEEIVSLINLIK